jgi:hypothetical protein
MIQNAERLNVKQKVMITDRKAKVHAEMEKKMEWNSSSNQTVKSLHV